MALKRERKVEDRELTEEDIRFADTLLDYGWEETSRRLHLSEKFMFIRFRKRNVKAYIARRLSKE